jgi:hypothetical protein
MGALLSRIAGWKRDLAFALVALVLCCAIAGARGVEPPFVADEFAYLLGADTFAGGHLTNPTPKHWTAFEALHVLSEPTRQMKYPPGQSVALAVGQLLGHPIIGVWLSFAAFAAAMSYAARAWLARTPALIATSLAIATTTFAGMSYRPMQWTQTYWGGAVAALGGALLLGALRRSTRAQAPARLDGVWLGLGCVLLAATRPLEGLVVILCALAAWVASFVGASPPQRRARLLRTVAPASVLVVAGALLLVLYNLAVTGQPLRMPYMEYEEQYSPTAFTWLIPEVRELSYRQETFLRFYVEGAIAYHRRMQALPGLLVVLWDRFLSFQSFYGGLATSTLALLGACAGRLRGRAAALLAALVAVLVVQALVIFGQPHYLAPVVAAYFILVGAGFDAVKRRAPRAALLVLIGAFAWALVAKPAVQTRNASAHRWHYTRAAIAADLSSKPTKALVLVRYGPRHSHHKEWVQNDADLDATRVLWAHDDDDDETAALVADEPERDVYSLVVDDDEAPPRLTRLAR